jgi:hypothetical protein
MQLYTLVQQGGDSLQFRNAFMNLGISLFLITETFPKKLNKDKVMSGSIISKAIPDGWSSWDRIEISGPMTVGEFNKYMLDKYEVNVTGIKDDEDEGDIVDTVSDEL